jgi:hypothetical protein
MHTIQDSQTSIELHFTLVDVREDLVAAVDHVAYSIAIEKPDETLLLECVTEEENDRFTVLSFVLDKALQNGEYKFTVYSMNEETALVADRNAALEVGTLRVLKTAANFTEPSISGSYVEP